LRETDRLADTKHKYDDILDCPHHVSSVHSPMPLIDRAAQFAPFSALTGYEEIVKEESRLTEQRVELDEEELERLDQSLQYLKTITGREGNKSRCEDYVFLCRPEEGRWSISNCSGEGEKNQTI